jgi:TRAP-type C4-dicarboxylate transport system permease small subunit
MAGHSPVLEDHSLFSRLDRALFSLERLLALISGLAVLGLMLLAVVSVVGRIAFNMPLRGYVDWVEAFLPLIAFMGIAFVQREGGHIRMDIVIGRLGGRRLWLAELVSVVLLLSLMAGMIWGSWAHFDRSFDFNAPLWSRDSSTDISLPLWPAKLLVPVAFATLFARLILQVWGYGRAFVMGFEFPPGVPLIQDAAEQAAAEADQLSKQG